MIKAVEKWAGSFQSTVQCRNVAPKPAATIYGYSSVNMDYPCIRKVQEPNTYLNFTGQVIQQTYSTNLFFSYFYKSGMVLTCKRLVLHKLEKKI